MKLLLVVLSVLVLSVAPTQTSTTSADIVFKNGNVYTANDRFAKGAGNCHQVRSDCLCWLKHRCAEVRRHKHSSC